jgi:hypothetical protein
MLISTVFCLLLLATSLCNAQVPLPSGPNFPQVGFLYNGTDYYGTPYILSVQTVTLSEGQSGLWLSRVEGCRFRDGNRWYFQTTPELTNEIVSFISYGDFGAVEAAGFAFVLDQSNPNAYSQQCADDTLMCNWLNNEIFAKRMTPYQQDAFGECVPQLLSQKPVIPVNITVAEYEALYYDYYCYLPGQDCTGYAATQNNILFSGLLSCDTWPNSFPNCAAISAFATDELLILKTQEINRHAYHSFLDVMPVTNNVPNYYGWLGGNYYCSSSVEASYPLLA